MTVLLNNLTDLSVEANLNEAWAALRLCATDAEFSAWARTFGEAALIAVSEGGLSDDLEGF